MADDAARRDANRHPSMLALEEGSGELRQVRVDSFGRLVVAGAGAEPTATTLKVADGAVNTRLLAVDANGRIGINNYPDRLTDAQLRASPVPITGNVLGPLTNDQLRFAPVPITGPVTGPLTNTELRASPLAISGPVTGPLTNAELRGEPLTTTTAALRVLFDYGSRTDSLPIYIGKAAQATALSAGTWVIQRFTYDSSNRPTDIQILTGVWNNRATLGWS